MDFSDLSTAQEAGASRGPTPWPKRGLAPAYVMGVLACLPWSQRRWPADRTIEPMYYALSTATAPAETPAGGGVMDMAGRLWQPDGIDLAIVQLVRHVQHIHATAIRDILFHDYASPTSYKNKLLRLTKHKFLTRFDRLPPGGSRGGSDQYLYRLGAEGHALFSHERFTPKRHTVKHSLIVADCLVTLHELMRAGLPVHHIIFEPDCYETIAGKKLEPDLYVELTHPASGYMPIMVEADAATEGRTRILEKIDRYLYSWYNSSDADRERWPRWPHVVFVAIDEDRVNTLKWYLRERRLKPDERGLFTVVAVHRLRGLLGGN